MLEVSRSQHSVRPLKLQRRFLMMVSGSDGDYMVAVLVVGDCNCDEAEAGRTTWTQSQKDRHDGHKPEIGNEMRGASLRNSRRPMARPQLKRVLG